MAKEIVNFDTKGIRKEYIKNRLSRCEMPADPMTQLVRWVEEAIGIIADDATAMILATVSPDGKPSTRTVLLKGIENGQLLFYTNYLSRKGRQIAVNPNVSLTLAWYALERQIHIEGRAGKIPPEESDLYFDSRPLESRIAAIISPQSQVVRHRMELIRRFLEEKESGRLVGRPEQWGGYAVTPERIEFWQGREFRLHDRILYTLQPDAGWSKVRLAP